MDFTFRQIGGDSRWKGDAIGPMEKIYVECVYRTGGLESTMGSGFKPQPHLHTHEAQRYEAHD